MKRIALALSVILASAALGGDGPGFLGDVTNTTTVTLGNSIGSYTYKDIAVTQPCSCVLVRVSVSQPFASFPSQVAKFVAHPPMKHPPATHRPLEVLGGAHVRPHAPQ